MHNVEYINTNCVAIEIMGFAINIQTVFWERNRDKKRREIYFIFDGSCTCQDDGKWSEIDVLKFARDKILELKMYFLNFICFLAFYKRQLSQKNWHFQSTFKYLPHKFICNQMSVINKASKKMYLLMRLNNRLRQCERRTPNYIVSMYYIMKEISSYLLIQMIFIKHYNMIIQRPQKNNILLRIFFTKMIDYLKSLLFRFLIEYYQQFK